CQVAGQLVAIARQNAEPEALGLVHYALGTSLYYRGDWTTAQDHPQPGLATYPAGQDQALRLLYAEDRGVVSHCHLAVLLWCLGYPEQAQHEIEAGTALAPHLAAPLRHTGVLGLS